MADSTKIVVSGNDITVTVQRFRHTLVMLHLDDGDIARRVCLGPAEARVIAWQLIAQADLAQRALDTTHGIPEAAIRESLNQTSES